MGLGDEMASPHNEKIQSCAYVVEHVPTFYARKHCPYESYAKQIAKYVRPRTEPVEPEAENSSLCTAVLRKEAVTRHCLAQT